MSPENFDHFSFFFSFNPLRIIRELSKNKILICNCSQLFKTRNTLFANLAPITNSCRSLTSVKPFARVVVVVDKYM